MPTIRVPVRLVALPTLVLANDGRVVSGLERESFRVFDNGRLQQVMLDTVSTPASVAVVVQVNRDVREYLPFISKVGSAVDALLVGERGQAAVIAYNEELEVLKLFGTGNVRFALRRLSTSGRSARMIDAGIRGIELLKDRPRARARVLLFIGQPMDRGSESTLMDLRERAEQENVTIYGLTLPMIGKSIVSDTFSMEGLVGADKQGYRSSTNLGKLIPALARTADAQKSADPFSLLTSATGGTQLHFHKQHELEDAIAIVGIELRSSYVLTFRPNGDESGYHAITIEVDVPGAKAYSRPGYWRSAN